VGLLHTSHAVHERFKSFASRLNQRVPQHGSRKISLKSSFRSLYLIEFIAHAKAVRPGLHVRPIQCCKPLAPNAIKLGANLAKKFCGFRQTYGTAPCDMRAATS